jgi:hypothetical protein
VKAHLLTCLVPCVAWPPFSTQKPHPKFRLIKRFYPQFFHFHDKEGHVCYYEALGKLDVQVIRLVGIGALLVLYTTLTIYHDVNLPLP